MRHLISFVFIVIFISACGGGGGSSNSEQNNSDLFEDAFAILNENGSPGELHSTVRRDSGNGRSVGCSEAYYISTSELQSFVESETAYALCGHQLNENENPLCIYPGSNAYRTHEISADSAHPDAQQEIITIPLIQGNIEVTLTYENLDFEYEFGAENNATDCDSDTLWMTTTYADSDIDGIYSAILVSIDSNGVPITESIGSISCDTGNCTGIVSISEMQYESSTESWSGLMTFGGIQFDLVATLSPNKSVAIFVGCPPFSEVNPKEISKSCLFIGAYK
ncbi:hypothetical protein HRM2_p00570 (plasmid) [Desulforapulum autotrophicum HRM2]|uniref:Lipoprotein n=1 Tax=Desulforapulum autotrophicum (strain ATCC 43914 / DSM 3382 / VKM B-1955 / HRM2) TaxID=177437 RepID=C0QMQ0_DESAH|nr:hypothetical protein [Desulforapulum autotrophicum]ACN18044.1 hypothetical protein HRM2_p00500 [Desulforapulum autotrophicum HRM2]ACN18051.1 hypothetical protein HRM2_p00570 [Desulforapulum autotrophicum HRM2]